MLYLRTTINGQYRYLDLFDDESIPMEYSYAEIQDITSKNSTYTKSFSLPGSKDNNDIFQHYYDINSSMTDYDIRSVFEAELLEDGFSIMRGYLRLENVSVLNKNVTYNVTFYSNVGLLTSNIGDKVLRDIDFSSLDHPYDQETIIRSMYDPDFSGGTQPYEDGRVTYMLAQYGYEYDSDKNIITNSTPIIDFRSGQVPGYFDFIGTPMRFYYMKPAVQVKWMYEQIFQEAGFTIQSDFFNTAYFKRFYLPLTFNTDSLYLNQAVRPEFHFLQDHTTDYNFQSQGISWTDIGVPGTTAMERVVQLPELANNINAHQYSNNTFIVQQAGNYIIQLSLQGFNLETQPDPFIDRDAVFEIFFHQIELGGPNGTSGSTLFTRIVNVRVGQAFNETYVFNVFLDPNYHYSIDVDVNASPAAPGELTYAEMNILDGPRTIVGDVKLEKELPDTEEKQMDWISTINRRFNLVVVPNPDDDKVFIIEPIIDYLNKGDVLDWSDRLDHNSNLTITPTTSVVNGTLFFNAQSDEDFGNVEFTKSRNVIYGTRYKQLNLDYKSTTTEFNGQVSQPVDDILQNVNTPNITIPIYYITREENNEGQVELFYNARKTKPRIVFRGLNIPANNVGKYNNPSGLTANNSFYIEDQKIDIFPMYNRFTTYPWGLTGFTHAVNYNKNHRFQQREYDFSCYEDLYDVYYDDYITDLSNSDNRVVIGSFWLHPEEISQLRGNERIFLNGNYYRINKINGYDLTKRSLTEVELIKITGDYEPHRTKYYKLQNCFDIDDVKYVNTDLNFTWWAYIGKKVKIEGQGCYEVLPDTFDESKIYEQITIPFQDGSLLPELYEDCLCVGPIDELYVYQELNCSTLEPNNPTGITQYYYYILENCVQPQQILARSTTYYSIGDVVRTSTGGNTCYFVFDYTYTNTTNDIISTYVDCETCAADVPTPTPSPSLQVTPTPSPSPCGCDEFEAQNEYPTTGYVDYTDCYGVSQRAYISPFGNFIDCGCAGSITASVGVYVNILGGCLEPTPTPSITPSTTPGLSPTPTPTPSTTPITCFEWQVENENPYLVAVNYTECCTGDPEVISIGAFQTIDLCSQTEPTGSVRTSLNGACPSPPVCSPTPTPTISTTISITPTPSKTPVPGLSPTPSPSVAPAE